MCASDPVFPGVSEPSGGVPPSPPWRCRRCSGQGGQAGRRSGRTPCLPDRLPAFGPANRVPPRRTEVRVGIAVPWFPGVFVVGRCASVRVLPPLCWSGHGGGVRRRLRRTPCLRLASVPTSVLGRGPGEGVPHADSPGARLRQAQLWAQFRPGSLIPSCCSRRPRAAGIPLGTEGERHTAVLVMRRSGVRLPKAAPHVRGPFWPSRRPFRRVRGLVRGPYRVSS